MRTLSPATAGLAIAAIATVVLGAGLSLAATAVRGTITRDDVLRAGPVATATPVGKIAQGASVDVIDRNGFWRRVSGPAGQVWLKLSSVRVNSGTTAGAGLAALATGRGATGNVVTTSGTRGISADDLTGATPDTAELQTVEALAVTPEQARAFAGEGHLVARRVEYVGRENGGRNANRKPANGD